MNALQRTLSPRNFQTATHHPPLAGFYGSLNYFTSERLSRILQMDELDGQYTAENSTLEEGIERLHVIEYQGGRPPIPCIHLIIFYEDGRRMELFTTREKYTKYCNASLLPDSTSIDAMIEDDAMVMGEY